MPSLATALVIALVTVLVTLDTIAVALETSHDWEEVQAGRWLVAMSALKTFLRIYVSAGSTDVVMCEDCDGR